MDDCCLINILCMVVDICVVKKCLMLPPIQFSLDRRIFFLFGLVKFISDYHRLLNFASSAITSRGSHTQVL